MDDIYRAVKGWEDDIQPKAALSISKLNSVSV